MSDNETELLELPAPSRKNRRWTLLLVGDSGRVVRIRRVRGWLTLVIALPVIALAVVAGGYLRSEKRPNQYRQTLEEVARLKDELRLLKEKHARPAAQPVAGGTETGALPRGGPKDLGRSAGESKPADAGPQAQGPVAAAEADEAAADAEAYAQTGSDDQDGGVVAPPSVVDVRDLSLALDADSGLVQVQFKIFNRQENGQPFSGYAFVVLKPEGSGSDRWLVFPDTLFNDEGPGSFESGYDFSISNYMTIVFDARHLGTDKIFQAATVLVYDISGRLVLSSDFDLTTRQ